MQSNDNLQPASPSSSDSSSLDLNNEDEFCYINLSEIRKIVQCPICLGILRKTRTNMECLHRFCKECIDKAMGLGMHECPLCRVHIASRRSLRDDPNFDALIAALYSDIDDYEKKELDFLEEDGNDGPSKKLKEDSVEASGHEESASDQIGNNSMSNHADKGNPAPGTSTENLLQVHPATPSPPPAEEHSYDPNLELVSKCMEEKKTLN